MTILNLAAFLISVFLLNVAKADNFTITPGSSITLGAHTVLCSADEELPEDRCAQVVSGNPKIDVCSRRLRGTRCVVNGVRGICDLANEGGPALMCKCH